VSKICIALAEKAASSAFTLSLCASISSLAAMATAPAQRRPKDGKAQYREAPSSDDEMRARRASANRVLTMLKAALNHRSATWMWRECAI
jgi:hypothetical protein